MNDADRAALAAWKDFRAAEDMFCDAASLRGPAPLATATRIRQRAFSAWENALNVATLKGGQ